MNRVILKENQTIRIDSNQQSEQFLELVVEHNATCIVEMVGEDSLTLHVQVKVLPEASLTCLMINNLQQKLVLIDQYDLFQQSQMKLAYCQLNPYQVETHSVYNLNEAGASMKVLTASITKSEKHFEQNTHHLAPHTSAQIENYGVVLAAGLCEMVVCSAIQKGKHDCQTHQTNRLLNYDKSSQGKILPILKIDDHEVVASHACSLGQPDENQIYYLQTRGLTYQQALQLITIGYLMPITKIIDDEDINQRLKEEIELKVNDSCLK